MEPGQSEKERVYALLASKNRDEIVSYAELDEALGRDFRSSRTPIYGARLMLEANDLKTITAVDTVGYRVVRADEHGSMATRHQRKAHRQVKHALSRARSADRNLLTDAERALINDHEARLGAMEQSVRRLSRRMARVEDQQTQQGHRQQRQERESQSMRARLDRLEEQLRSRGLVDDEDSPAE